MIREVIRPLCPRPVSCPGRQFSIKFRPFTFQAKALCRRRELHRQTASAIVTWATVPFWSVSVSFIIFSLTVRTQPPAVLMACDPLASLDVRSRHLMDRSLLLWVAMLLLSLILPQQAIAVLCAVFVLSGFGFMLSVAPPFVTRRKAPVMSAYLWFAQSPASCFCSS
jgi:hypothetical protein